MKMIPQEKIVVCVLVQCMYVILICLLVNCVYVATREDKLQRLAVVVSRTIIRIH